MGVTRDKTRQLCWKNANTSIYLMGTLAILMKRLQEAEGTLVSVGHQPLKFPRFDYRLTSREKSKLAANGVLALGRMPAQSFADVYDQLYRDDMPVFVTSDSVLHAWHRSFDAFLVELEVEVLCPTLDKVLVSTLSKCRDTIMAIAERDVSGVNSMLDVELFLCVGLCLLRGEQLGSLSENRAKVESFLTLIDNERTMKTEIFSAKREIDFSQFKPRGHYMKSEELTRYFRAMIWLGTIDFRVAGGENRGEDLHQLHCAALLVQFLQECGSLEIMENIDRLISSLMSDGGVGANSLSPSQLAEFLYRRDDEHNCKKRMRFSFGLDLKLGRHLKNGELYGIHVLNVVPSSCNQLLELQKEILLKGRGVQHTNGHPRVDDELREPTTPIAAVISFALLGQRFVWSSFIFSRVVYDQVLHNDKKQVGRITSAVDIAFTLFGNDVAAQVLADRMNATPSKPSSNSTFVPFRDGIPFTSNLVAARHVIENEIGDKGEEITSMNGMVDPYPLFWQRMVQLAKRMEGIIDHDVSPLVQFFGARRSFSHDTDWFRSGARGFFRRFADTMQSLESIATDQIKHKKLSEDKVKFLKSVMDLQYPCGIPRPFGGWYPRLFYDSREDSGKRDVLVADVLTDSPSPGHFDPGGVLHLGVGDPLMGFFVVDKTMYAGPVFSSYEFVTSIDERLTDEEFKSNLPTMQMPDWARQSYLC